MDIDAPRGDRITQDKDLGQLTIHVDNLVSMT